MRTIAAMVTAMLVVASGQGCSSSSSAQFPSRQMVAPPVDFVENIAPLTATEIVFTGFVGPTPSVWTSDFTEDGTEEILANAHVLGSPDARIDPGLVWRGRAILRSPDGPSGGLFWLSDGTADGTIPYFDISEPPLEVQVFKAQLQGNTLILNAFFSDSVTVEQRLYRINLLAPNE